MEGGSGRWRSRGNNAPLSLPTRLLRSCDIRRRVKATDLAGTADKLVLVVTTDARSVELADERENAWSELISTCLLAYNDRYIPLGSGPFAMVSPVSTR